MNVFSALYYNAERLITDIRSSSSIDNMVALGYIFGVVDTHSAICGWKLTGVTGPQLVQIKSQKTFLKNALKVGIMEQIVS